MSEFEQNLTSKIAEIHGVDPSEVTLENIRKWREQLYQNPNHRFIDSRAVSIGLEMPTPPYRSEQLENEIDELFIEISQTGN